MTFLEDLNFIPIGKLKKSWVWKNIFYVGIKVPSKHGFGKTRIIKNSEISFTGDERENILFRGSYCLDNEDFANKLFKNIGVLEKIYETTIVKQKEINHISILTNLGFIEIEQNIWTKNIFLISLVPPRFDTDRGKCLILKKPNVKKLKENIVSAGVVYKGRYFFDDIIFTETLLEKIGFYHFDNGQKNKKYEFVRETVANNKYFIDKEFLKF